MAHASFHNLAGAVSLACALVAVPAAAQKGNPGFAEIQRGRYLTIAGDCIACHTAKGGEEFAGGRAIPTPFGTLYGPNLTPDIETGLGGWTEEQFITAMTEGIGPEGQHYYPAFPYPYFTKVKREDLQAIWAYLNTLEPVYKPEPENELMWPFSMREVMIGWNTLFFEQEEFTPNPEKSAEWNRGAYLVEGLAHCGACHTPRNVFGAAEEDQPLAGASIQDWYAPNLGPDLQSGLGDWSEEDIVRYLKTGTTGEVFAAGLMAEVVEYSTSRMAIEDLEAIATYLKDFPGTGERQAGGDAEPEIPDAVVDARAGTRYELGYTVYMDNCIGCHRVDGSGIQNVFPSLRDNISVVAEKPTSVIRVILRGAEQPSTEARPTIIAMPAFDWKLSDDEIAAVATYIRSAWGNAASPVDVSTVAEIRESTATEQATKHLPPGTPAGVSAE
jgi:mono/diheme cytochrome c family protein